MEFVTLNNGVKMPKLGFGVFMIPNDEAQKCVLEAIDVGYRLIDTAQAYGNEEGVGNAIAQCGLAREDLFITSKIWVSNSGYERAKVSIDESLRRLKSDYIDLMLIHQPFGDCYGTYRAMEEAREAGKLRAIGVSNFYPDRYIDLAHFVKIRPAVNQIETHVFHQQKEAHEYLVKYGAQHMAWAPFAEGKNGMFTNETLRAVGEKHGKTAAQVALRYLMQSDVVVIPKSVRRERMEENFNVFDFVLDEADMHSIAALDAGKTLFFSHNDPATAERFAAMGK